jgi:hypothetical protein
MDDYLVEHYDVSNVSFSKPKKQGEYMATKPKYSTDGEIIIQLPKMKLLLENKNNSSIELLFTNKNTYSKKVYNFLSKFDDYIIEYIHNNSEEWFGKKIPLDKLDTMYNKMLKAPKNSESECSINCVLKTKNCVFVDNKKNELVLSDFKNDSTVECISKLKYIIFSKDKCFPVWEIIVMKLHKKINKVPKNAFIDDEPPQEEEEDIEEYCFFN